VSAVLKEPEVFEAADTGAPIVLITGMPGAGKTNYALSEFALGKRDVWQANIPGCSLPSFDPTKWKELLETIPVDSTLLFDECREIFPPRNAMADPPEHYVLNRIRHTGRRVVLLAQHPSDIDSRVRRLCGRHLHLVEIFGGGGAKVYEWRQKIGDVEGTKEDALVSQFVHNPRVFKLYKSTELHRGAAKKPWKVRAIKWILLLALVLLLAGIGWIWHSMSKLSKGDTPVRAGVVSGSNGIAPKREGDRNRVLSPAEYADSFSPRVPGLAYTATRYDEVTKPKRAPFPAACVASSSRCNCYSQQATALEVPESLCRQIVARGMFMDFDPDGERSALATGAAAPVVAQASTVPGHAVSMSGYPSPPSASASEPESPLPGVRRRGRG